MGIRRELRPLSFCIPHEIDEAEENDLDGEVVIG